MFRRAATRVMFLLFWHGGVRAFGLGWSLAPF
jgi:hypothetical protein